MPEVHQKTKPDIPVWLAAIIVIGLFILGNVYNHYETARKNNSSKPFDATVISRLLKNPENAIIAHHFLEEAYARRNIEAKQFFQLC